MAQTFVQVPPQSTGKKILTTERRELYFDNQTQNFEIGMVVTGAVSGASGTVSAIVNEGFAPSAGKIFLKNFTGTFVNNENLQVLGSTFAIADLTTSPEQDVDLQSVVISDPNNPDYKQAIDRFGATVNTFSDGSPVFGPFGTLTVGEPQVIKFYRFAMDNDNPEWRDSAVGGGIVSWDSDRTASTLTNGTMSGDLAQRTTNYYHPYVPGVGRNVEFTAQFGDNGKSGLRRRMGYYDDENGFFFEQDSAGLYVVVRSSSSGTTVDTRVLQSDWNLDQADGTDNIGFNLDVTKANMYYIDLQWHGAGRVKFGCYEPDGERIPLHIFRFGNISTEYPYTQTATLPMRFEQENVGSTVSTSEMRWTSAVVRHSSKVTINGDKFTESSSLKEVRDSDGEKPILSFRPSRTFNGVTNRGIIKGLSFEGGNFGNAPVLWRLRSAPDSDGLVGANFNSISPLSFTQTDSVATAVNPLGAKKAVGALGAPNSVTTVDIREPRELHSLEAYLNADGVTQPEIILTAEVIGTGSTNVIVSLDWEEFKL